MVVVVNPADQDSAHAFWFTFKASNNKAEYEAFITSLRLAKNLGAYRVCLLSNSRIVVTQIKGEFIEKEDQLGKYLEIVKQLIETFEVIPVEQQPNWHAFEACLYNTGAR